MTYHFLHIL